LEHGVYTVLSDVTITWGIARNLSCRGHSWKPKFEDESQERRGVLGIDAINVYNVYKKFFVNALVA